MNMQAFFTQRRVIRSIQAGVGILNAVSLVSTRNPNKERKMESEEVGADDARIEEIAKTAQTFLNGITRLGIDLKMDQAQAVLLFGLFARRCVDHQVKNGMPRDQACMELTTAFMKGMGMDVMMEKADPEEVAALEAKMQHRRGPLE